MKDVMLMLPSDWAIKAIAVLVVDEIDRLIVVKEIQDDPKIGKFYGMTSIPMGHLCMGETAQRAAIREFGEETGKEIKILYPIGFFDILMVGAGLGDRAGVVAFYGRLTGKIVPKEVGQVELLPSMPQSQFQQMNDFQLRPLNRQIYNAWKALNLLVRDGKDPDWISKHLMETIPAQVRRLWAME